MSNAVNHRGMQYRRLGRSGLQVSVLSFGSWATFDAQLKDDLASECMQTAYDAGCNFFDNAEVYAGGESEAIMGRVVRQLSWPRWSYVLTTKVYWGLHDVPVWAMSDIVSAGKAHYWGTSEWAADEIRGAIEIAERHHLHKPITEQPQYNLLERDRMEREYARLFDETGYGATIWSPLASGLLTGKYRDGVPDGSRAALPGFDWLAQRMADPTSLAKVERLRPIADEIGCTLAQLALAWCVANPNVSTVITGASRPSQVTENFAALDVVAELDDERLARIDDAVA